MSKWDKKFELSSGVKIDVVATLGDRIKVKNTTLAEGQFLQRKHSAWRIQLFQEGAHSYKATE